MDIVINIDEKKDQVVFSLSGRLDAISVPQLEERLGQWYEYPGAKLIFDLEKLDYISSAGLRVFLSAAKKLKARHGKLCLAGLQQQVKEVFTLAGFDILMPSYNTLEEAQNAAD